MKPLHVRCFDRHFTIAFFVVGALLLSSCQRATDEKTKVSITLPGNSKLSTQSLSYTAPVIVDKSNESKNSFLNIVPSTNSSSKYPINCYAVMVGGPEQEFKTSFCGQRDASNNLTHDIDFGPYQALVPVTDTTSPTFDFEVTAGASRQFYVIGIYATNIKSCRDINTNPEKYNLSHPYLIGVSDPVSLKGGVDATVKIKLNDPQLGNAKIFDDCIVARDDLRMPLANFVRFDSTLFSGKYIRNPSTGFSCEAVDVSLRYLASGTGNDFADYSLGTVNDATAAHIKMDNVATVDPYVATFSDAVTCASGQNGYTAFYFQRNEFKKRRWIRVSNSGSTRTLSASVDLPSGTISTINAFNFYTNINKNSTTILDTAVPRKILVSAGNNNCYPVTSYFLSGDSTKVSADVTTAVSFDATDVSGGTNKILVYASSSDCTSSISQITGNASASSSDTSKTFWIKTSSPNANSPVRFTVHDTSGSRADSKNLILIGTEVDDAIGSVSRVSTLEFWGRPYLSYSNGCVPLHIYYSNAFRTNIAAQSAGTLEYLDTQSKSADIGLYADASCSGTEIYTANANTTIANFNTGDTSAVVYMKVKTSPASNYTDMRSLIFSYTENGHASILGHYDFSLNKEGY